MRITCTALVPSALVLSAPVLSALLACDPSPSPQTPAIPGHTEQDHREHAAGSVEALQESATRAFAALPAQADSAANPITDAKVQLGRHLYYEKRLSKNHDRSCNSCHLLNSYGVDGLATSTGHKEQLGGRNSPSTYVAALHSTQFWDGRAATVEEQALAPILNPIEMAMPDAEAAEATLRSIPGYAPLFQAAFPGQDQPITFDNVGLAIGAFERKLMTPAPFDAFLGGDISALSDPQQRGLRTFMGVGCASCHSGAALGGSTFMKMGLVHPYETADEGRFEVTQLESDKQVFKVPSLRNIHETGPWLHDGSITSLDEMIRLMGWHQLGLKLDDQQVADLSGFLGSLTGTLPADLVRNPAPLASGPSTPAPDPS